ncbi:Tat (twin-arginine translocation) pathway signal sequence [Mucilaginibacter sp. OK268]|uniref:sugar phosphate isomerase/epimerase family protein n=1 Tax=Mucilaginibacter sp. OK268 TaxID=1881048 RepID=UPI000891F7C4|nr:TIM barrel protein [Mucilaginibacter sp. OK268]SDP78696.1 Tat (twin-arginine translocation) pathway signal sequence [Mucilaginibacter sp. OK268]
MTLNRRDFITRAAMGAAGIGIAASIPDFLYAKTEHKADGLFFKLALSQFSLASQFWSKKLDPLDFPMKTKTTFGIEGLDYCSMFFADKAEDSTFLNELKKRSADNGCYNLRIMVDGEGVLGHLDAAERTKAIENHYKWIDAAALLGCPMIRVNVEGEGAPEEVAKAAADSLAKLIAYGSKSKIDVIVENHVGISCNGAWLAGVMKSVNNKHCGTLADFGNFCINRTKPEAQTMDAYMKTKCLEEYDRYKGITELMPYAKGVHAKSHTFDAAGNDTETDYYKMFGIIKKSGFNGWVSIEYEGGLFKMYAPQSNYLDDDAGVIATKKLVEKAGKAA